MRTVSTCGVAMRTVSRRMALLCAFLASGPLSQWRISFSLLHSIALELELYYISLSLCPLFLSSFETISLRPLV